jgi:hypothetical protein
LSLRSSSVTLLLRRERSGMPEKSVKDECCSTMSARVPAASPTMPLLQTLRDNT